MSRPEYWLSASVLTMTSAPSFRHASRPAWKPAARPLLFVSRTMWSTPLSRATSIVRSVEPSSMTSHSTASKPGTSRGRSASVAGSVSSSLRQGIWMMSFMQKGRGRRAGKRQRRRAVHSRPQYLRGRDVRSHATRPNRSRWTSTTAWRARRSPRRPAAARRAGARLRARRLRAALRRGAHRVPGLPDLSRTTTALLADLGPGAARTGHCRPSTPTARRPSTRWRWPSARCSSLLGDDADRGHGLLLRRLVRACSSPASTGSAARVVRPLVGLVAALLVLHALRLPVPGRARLHRHPVPGARRLGGGAGDRAPAARRRRSWSCSPLAGLLRPEAWLLSGAVLAVAARGRRARAARTCASERADRGRYAAIAPGALGPDRPARHRRPAVLAAPHERRWPTTCSARSRPREAPSFAIHSLNWTLKWPVLIGAVLGVALALRLRAPAQGRGPARAHRLGPGHLRRDRRGRPVA